MESKQVLEVYKNFAVIGVSKDHDKYGYKIFKRLIEKGYHTFGISPIYDQVDGYQLYKSLEDINHPIDVVVFVVNKKYAKDYIDQMRALGIGYAWMQPNTYDDEILAYLELNGIHSIIDCILIKTK